MRRLLSALSALVLVALPAAASGASLPSVRSGARPGPSVLYAKPAKAPELSVRAPFRARPLLVSGTDAYRAGEYLYQDYLYDDHGADTGSAVQKPGTSIFANGLGDASYPTAERFAANAADLVELRIRPTRTAVVYRVTLSTLKARDTAAIGIGIDTDRRGGAPVAWPGGAGVATPGLDRFILAWGTGGRVWSLPGGPSRELRPSAAVTANTRTNQITIRVPRSLMNPRSSTWRYVVGVGLREGEGFKPVPAGRLPTADQSSSGNADEVAPAVFNLGFRFAEDGFWYEDRQAGALADGTSGGFRADVDFGRLRARVSRWLHRPGRQQARIYASRLQVFEGVRSSTPHFGGRLQPYIVNLPSGLSRRRPAGLTWGLHSLSANYRQHSLVDPNYLRQLGDRRHNVFVTTQGRGADGFYRDEAELDFFEVWADVARRFPLDSERVAISGYSMGGFGTYSLALAYPDLFGGAFSIVGLGTKPTLLGNVRSVPFLSWVAEQDELVPYEATRAVQAELDRLGLRSLLETFQGGHFALAGGDEWGAGARYLGRARVTRDPSRVDYAYIPADDRPRLRLVRDHAYWLSRLRGRGAPTDTSYVTARSLAFGVGDPPLRRVDRAGVTSGRPTPSRMEGTQWGRIPKAARSNALELTLRGVRSVTVDGRRARLHGGRRLRIRVTSDGRARVRVRLGFPARARALGESAASVTLRRRAAVLRVSTGTREYSIVP